MNKKEKEICTIQRDLFEYKGFKCCLTWSGKIELVDYGKLYTVEEFYKKFDR